MPRDKPKRHPTLRQSKSALLEAAQEAVADQNTRAAEAPSGMPQPVSRTGFRGFLLLLILGGAGLLAARPAWLTGPALPTEPPAIRRASATLSLAEAVGQVKSYAAAHGRLPATLDAAGVRDSAIRFRPIGAGAFEVSLAVGDTSITLRSTEPLKGPVVDAILTLQRRN